MKLMGFSSLNIGSTSTVKWGNEPSACRARARQHRVDVRRRQDGRAEGRNQQTADPAQERRHQQRDVYVSIIPFSKDVNVDSEQLQLRSWIDWTDWNDNNGTCKDYTGRYEPTASRLRRMPASNWKTAKHNTWNGCVIDRGNSKRPTLSKYDTNVTHAEQRQRYQILRRAIRLLPAGRHAAELRLDFDDHARRPT